MKYTIAPTDDGFDVLVDGDLVAQVDTMAEAIQERDAVRLGKPVEILVEPKVDEQPDETA